MSAQDNQVLSDLMKTLRGLDLDTQQLLAVRAFAIHLKHGVVHPMFFKQIADAFAGEQETESALKRHRRHAGRLAETLKIARLLSDFGASR